MEIRSAEVLFVYTSIFPFDSATRGVYHRLRPIAKTSFSQGLKP